MPVQFEIGDNFRVKQAHRVGGDRVAEAGMEFLRDRRASDNRATLQELNLEAGAGEIGGADEPVVSAAED